MFTLLIDPPNTRRTSRTILLLQQETPLLKKEKETETTCHFEAVNGTGVFVNTVELAQPQCLLGTDKFPLVVRQCHHKADLLCLAT